MARMTGSYAEQQASEIEKGVERIRNELGRDLEALSERRHVVQQARHWIRAHRWTMSAIAGALLLIAGTATTTVAMRRRRRLSAWDKARRLRRAMGRMVRHPERVASRHEPSFWHHVVTAVVAGALSAAAKTATGVIVRRKLETSSRGI